jgi:RND family efflux transporter MFP subunit
MRSSRLAATFLATPTLALAFAAAAPQAAAPVHQKAGDSIRTETVKRSDLRLTLTAQGVLEPARTVELYSRVSGTLVDQRVDVGDKVVVGQALARVDSPDATEEAQRNRVRLRQARTQLTRAKSALTAVGADSVATRTAYEAAQSELTARERALRELRETVSNIEADVTEPVILVDNADRIRASTAARDAAKARVDTAAAGIAEARTRARQAQADVTLAESNVRVAEANLKQAETLAASATIRSPLAGVISRREGDPGDVVRKPADGASKPLFTIVMTDPMRVVVRLPEADASLVKPGQPAVVRLPAQADRTWVGKVKRVVTIENAQRPSLRAEIEVPNHDGRLRASEPAAVDIEIGVRNGALTVPRSAVVGSGDETACYRVVGSRAVRTRVQIGAQEGERVEVISGLKEGEKVIPHPDSKLVDGQRVDVDSRK